MCSHLLAKLVQANFFTNFSFDFNMIYIRVGITLLELFWSLYLDYFCLFVWNQINFCILKTNKAFQDCLGSCIHYHSFSVLLYLLSLLGARVRGQIYLFLVLKSVHIQRMTFLLWFSSFDLFVLLKFLGGLEVFFAQKILVCAIDFDFMN